MALGGWRLSCTDPRDRPVRCWEGAWHHIIQDHPDLATAEDIIRSVIETPDEIYYDSDNENRECYYRFDVQVHNVRCSVKVVVEFGTLWRVLGGAVITVFEKYDVSPGNVKRRERKIWPP